MKDLIIKKFIQINLPIEDSQEVLKELLEVELHQIVKEDANVVLHYA